MMMTCGHVITKDSLTKLCKSGGYVSFICALSAHANYCLKQAFQVSLLPDGIHAQSGVAGPLLNLVIVS